MASPVPHHDSMLEPALRNGGRPSHRRTRRPEGPAVTAPSPGHPSPAPASSLDRAPQTEPSLVELDNRLRRYCRSLMKSPWDAEDLVQDVWVKALKGGGFAGHPNKEALLLRIAKTTWIDRLRQRAARERLGPDAWAIQVGAQPAEAVDSPASITVEEAFGLLVDRLSPLERAAVVLRELLGFSVREAAVLLQTSEGAVKVALHRARRTLSAVQDGKNGQEGVTQLLRQEDGGTAAALAREMASAYLAGDVSRLVQTLAAGARASGPAKKANSRTQAANAGRQAMSVARIGVFIGGKQGRRALAFLCRRSARRGTGRFGARRSLLERSP